jgi:superfamily II DNA or RNA helicase
MYYPWYRDPDFLKKITGKKELYENKLQPQSKKRCLTNYQYAVSNFINPASPYSSLLLYFATGVGKTSSAIAIAENFIRSDKNKKVIVITKNNTLINNFKQDLMNVCSDYTIEKKPRNYTFVTYNFIKKNDLELTNKIVIVDEVHNLVGNDGYTKLKALLDKSKNYKLILLSATPAYDSITDMFQISNLLNGKNLQFNIKKLKEEGYSQDLISSENYLYKNRVFGLTDIGTKTLMSALHGKISYLKTDESDFPSISFPKSIKSINGKDLGLPVIKCVMDPYQNKRYLAGSEAKELNIIEGTYELLSSIIYPDLNGKYIYGAQGMEYYINQKKSYDFLLRDQVLKYSTKLFNLLENLGDPDKLQGKIFINARNIMYDGVPLINACLRKNNFKKIIVITSDLSPSKIISKIQDFNSEDNDNGEKYQILIASGLISEGITLKSIRQVHIYEPSWNYSSIDQTIGRAVRKSSHSRLPVDKRKVDIYLYCAISSNLDNSVDFAKYYLSSIKDKTLKKFERLVAKDSFTCSLFKKQNIKNGIDVSRECDYQECNYSCNYEAPSFLTVDDTTYNMFLHNKEKYKEISEKVVKIFGKTKDISLDDIVTRTGELKEDIVNIMKYSPPVGVIKIKDIYTLNNGNLPKKTGVLGKKVEKNIEFTQSGDIFYIEIGGSSGGKTSKKNCLTGFKKEELLNIAKSKGITIPSSYKKEEICQELKKLL